jgi:hypothetical protein
MEIINMNNQSKVLENRLRRVAERRGLGLRKSRTRDPQSLSYGRYHLLDLRSHTVGFGYQGEYQEYGATLEEIEAYLAQGDK